MAKVGDMVGYQFGVESVKAEVLGVVKDADAYLLRLKYIGKCPETGKENTLVVKEFQRDRKWINNINTPVRSPRYTDTERLSAMVSGPNPVRRYVRRFK